VAAQLTEWESKAIWTLYYDNVDRIASLYWNGPWTRTDNQFAVANLNSEEYTLNISPIQECGILGDVSVIVAQTGR
jgi:Aegerolysin.